MDLMQKQGLFVVNLAKLILFADSKKYVLTFGEAYRPPELAKLYAEDGRGVVNSLHTLRLAVDFNLFINGIYHTRSESFKPLGTYWKTLHELNRWGGDFKDSKGRPKPDGNHFSMEHNGVK